MKLKTKKILAREILMIIISALICLLAFGFGLFLNKVESKKWKKIKDEIVICDNQTDNYYNNFSKNLKVDSILKIQLEFYSKYSELLHHDTLDQGNYFFWKNIRKSIQDSTFHFTYASDEIIELIISNYSIRNILDNNKKDRLNDEYAFCATLNDCRNEFKLFALSNGYEKYISPYDWSKYQELREKKIKLQRYMEKVSDAFYDDSNIYYYYEGSFLEYAFFFCIYILFLLRYFYYLVNWSIKTIKSKED